MHQLHRTEINLCKNRITDVLPDYFKTEYPELVLFLEEYYKTHEFDDGIIISASFTSDTQEYTKDSANNIYFEENGTIYKIYRYKQNGYTYYDYDRTEEVYAGKILPGGDIRLDTGVGFGELIHELFSSRDMYATSNQMYKNLIPDLTNGVDISEILSDYRLKGYLLANYYRKKGSLYGMKEFFRWLLDENVEIKYTKENVFRVYDANQPETADSKIGTKSFRYLKNDKLYQAFAVLIKSGFPVSKWKEMYKRYAHPAGFYFEGSVVLEGVADLSLGEMPLNVPVTFVPLNGYGTLPSTFVGVSEITTSSSVTGLYGDSVLD